MDKRKFSLESLFRKLGFPKLASKLYLYILKQGMVEISELLGVFKSYNVEDDLTWLEKNGLTFRQINSEQKEYLLPIDPQISSRSLYSRFLWNFVPSEQWLSRLNRNTLKAISEYHQKCSLFAETVRPIYNSSKFLAESSGLEMIPCLYLSNALSSSISAASREILGITVFPWTPNIGLVWESLKERMASGVRYRRITDEITFIAFGHLINYRDVFEIGVDLRLVKHEEISEKFYVIDNREAFVFFPEVSPWHFRLEGMKVSIGSLVQMYKETFNHLWDRGISGRIAVEYMNSIRNEFIDRATEGLSNIGKSIMQGLFDYGKFFKLTYLSYSSQFILGLLDSLALKNYVVPFPDSETGFIPNMVSDIRRFIDEKRK